MKKLFSLVALLMAVFALSACDTEDLEQQIADLEAQISTLQTDLATAQDSNDDMIAEIAALEAELLELQNSTYDIVVTVTVTKLDGSSYFISYGFDEEDDVTLFDILDESFTLTYTTSEYGHYISGINEISTYNGSYLALYQNDTMSMVGVDDVIIADGDSFELKHEWWDTTQQAVYEALQLFMMYQLDDYLTDDYVDYSVLLGCQNLCDGNLIYESVNDNDELETYVDAMTTDSVTSYFKAIMLSNAVLEDAHTLALVNGLQTLPVTTGGYGQTAYGLLALDSYSHGLDYTAFVTSALDYYRTNTPENEGLDSGGIALVALAKYADETGIQTLIDDFAAWIVEDQLPSGGIKTRDMTYGDTTYPGTENAASMAQVILGLVANGIDPAAGDYVQGANNLVLRLTQYQLEDGSFDWLLTDDIYNDKAFSTPQAFLALSAYFQMKNDATYTHPFDFNE
jgi:hypothetical protein